MKRNNLKYGFSLWILGLLMSIMSFSACEKDQHVKPISGTFEVSHEIPTSVPAEGGSFELVIDASTNGWWIETSDEANWLTINRKYGSAKTTQNIVVMPNNSGDPRETSIQIHSTSKDTFVLTIKQQ